MLYLPIQSSNVSINKFQEECSTPEDDTPPGEGPRNVTEGQPIIAQPAPGAGPITSQPTESSTLKAGDRPSYGADQ